MQANQNPQNQQQRITRASSCNKQTVNIGRSYDVKHFLAHNVTLQNLKPSFYPLTRQHITGVFRNLHFCLSFSKLSFSVIKTAFSCKWEAKPRGNICVFPSCKRGLVMSGSTCCTLITQCATGVQPVAPASPRVQSAWLGPGEAA